MEMKHILNANSRNWKREHDSKQNEKKKKVKKCYIEINCLKTYFYKQIWFECLLVSSCVLFFCYVLFYLKL